ncbi:MAG: hypothetical protein JGK24_10525 [Microcoleus sp. PH2017_29_MFU_D_A]|uniref:hypothetical protein n=1 Tax=unclassified Microcoleus TaxID=2642155 RepID=UPI001DED90D3|nr:MULTISPECIES: hypothetical protein [unclassified Microcoleus]MCC3419342.1 hypothetical protein [Microcoleus sp. PH2017_07_MST_O_A]MCC3453814.1 hypothetical protein [Microcoleus sp. PH2017_08_TRC_O_A]MCC3592254.1 hypothetical protein [Microcoleus sp. PH2017_28_MFU_U_A]MCC3603664.1 hypothetical protein [Microcoleus sp. PH2017_29_MFU_D_A]MCC3636651.1 hypothetical protein [Microcoleus sp. PH2017_37_MFU_D_B]
MRDKGISEILIFGFGCGMLWDFITTFLGVVTIVAGPNFSISMKNIDTNTFGVYGIAFVGTVIVFCFNLITKNVWNDAREGKWTLLPIWFLCVVFDFVTSLAGNYKFILPGRQNEIAVIGVVWFTTLLTTISPMTVYYLMMDYEDKNR